MNDWSQFVRPELLVLIPVLYLLGKGLKKSAVKDKWIPFVLGGFGILLSVLYVLANQEISSGKQVAEGIFTAVTQGILLAGGSVYFDQMIKQAKKEN